MKKKPKNSPVKRRQTTLSQLPPPAPYLNAEKSWLSFNDRVFSLASQKPYPLMERLLFLSIAANNLDEFFMVHYGQLKNKLLKEEVKENLSNVSGASYALQQTLQELKLLSMEQLRHHVQLWRKLRRELREVGLQVVSPKDLTDDEIRWLEKHFLENIFPLLTPMAIDTFHPVPLIQSQTIAVAVELKSPDHETSLFAVIPLPKKLPRFIEIALPPSKNLSCPPSEKRRYIAIEHIISLFLEKLFSHYTIHSQGIFRLLRNSQMVFEEEPQTQRRLRDEFELALSQRLRGEVVQLTVSARMPEPLRFFVAEQFQVNPKEMIIVDGFLGIEHIKELVSCPLPHKEKFFFPSFKGRIPLRVRYNKYDIMEAISMKDILLHHPYESFDVVLLFLQQASKDPNVVSIKMTLYRTGSHSLIVESLIQAAKNGKSVTVLVEIKARFDEEANIQWTKDLEAVGAHVIYGIRGLKTHGKMCLVVRKEGNKMRSYAHFATGNYNPKTAAIYEDLSLLTANEVLCQDAAKIFHYISGYARMDQLEKVSVSPFNLREKITCLIDNEIHLCRQGSPGEIWMKMNSLTDRKIIDKLYEASQAGVKITLVIRGMCSLVPSVKGFSENIRVKSLLGRFLEHARIYCFGNGASLPNPSAKVFLSSADMMTRNLDWRLETFVPAENPTVHKQILEEIMANNIQDQAGSWELSPEGKYLTLNHSPEDFSAQNYFMENPSLSGNGVGPYAIKPHLVQSTDWLTPLPPAPE